MRLIHSLIIQRRGYLHKTYLVSRQIRIQIILAKSVPSYKDSYLYLYM
jgi:hypothetical protein